MQVWVWILHNLASDKLSSCSRKELICPEGMPLVNDPGSGLVKAAAEHGLGIHPIPGPSAVLAALVASGLPTDSFLFCGFLPPKQGARLATIEGIRGEPRGIYKP